MRAWVLEEFGGPLRLRDVPVPTIAPHEVLVRVRNVGICGTDLKIRAGRMGLNVLPLIMGHEVAGEVAEVGSQVQGVQPGDRVTVNFYVTCGAASSAVSVATRCVRTCVNTVLIWTAALRST